MPHGTFLRADTAVPDNGGGRIRCGRYTNGGAGGGRQRIRPVPGFDLVWRRDNGKRPLGHGR